jgi:putative addiction module killer protein
MQSTPREIRYYQTLDGKVPFLDWRSRLETAARIFIDARLTRVEAGNFGDTKSLGANLYELRIPKGSGFRIYYGLDGVNVVLLLCGGDKSTQQRDINKAREYWANYKKEL